MIVSTFIIQANVIMIVNYNIKTFIVLATGLDKICYTKIPGTKHLSLVTQSKCNK
jgi:hypothetical protein